MSTEKNSAAVRDARRRLATQIRTDFSFDWPTQKHNHSSNEDTSAGLRDGTTDGESEQGDSLTVTSTRVNNADTIWASALDWRERTYGSSDPSSGSDNEDDNERGEDGTSLASPRPKNRRSPSAMSIDAAPVDVEQKKMERKRRRQQRLEEEMTWNEGMAHWIARRDAWCCARLEPRQGPLSKPVEKSENVDEPVSSVSDTAPPSAGEEITDVKSWPSTDTSSSKADDGLSEQPSNERWSIPSAPASSVTSASQHSVNLISTAGTATARALAASRPSSYNALLPIPPPLLPPDDPTRASITPSIYPSIYSKIVTQSLTPSVPINLAHMIKALVQGWKNDGEWPPKAAPEKVGVDSKGRPVIISSNQSGFIQTEVSRSRAAAAKKRLLDRRRGNNNGGEKRLSLNLGGSSGHHWGKIWKDRLSGSHERHSPPPDAISPGPKEIGSHIFGHHHSHHNNDGGGSQAARADNSVHHQQLALSPKHAESGQDSPGFRKNVAARVGRVLRLSIGGSEKMSTDSSPESAAGGGGGGGGSKTTSKQQQQQC